MSESRNSREAHTPGPWEVAHRAPLVRVVSEPKPTIAAVITTKEADAHLIAAAPDLLAALQSIAQYDQRWKGQRVNDAPSRQQLVERAYDAWSLITRSVQGVE